MRVLTGMPARVVGVEAGGKLSTENYAKVLAPAPALTAATKDGGKIRIVLFLSGEFDGLEPGAVGAGRQDRPARLERMGADRARDRSCPDAGRATDVRLAVPGEVRAFRAGEQEEAIAWAAATPEKP